MLVLLLLGPDAFAQSMPGRKVELQPAQPRPEVRHAREAAVTEYPLRATQLDLSALSVKEQEEIHRLVNDPKKTYVAIGRDVHLSASNWAVVKREDGFEIWQAQIHSPAAVFLKVRFRDFDLGLGEAVKVYGLSAAGGAPVAEYTGHGLGDEGKFWSLRVPGDTVVVEHWVPVGREVRPGDFPFKVERISHGFRDAEGRLSGVDTKNFEPRSHGACRDGPRICSTAFLAARGVAAVYVTTSEGLEFICSGALLNNGSGPEDSALYFLTAFHCIDDEVVSSETSKEVLLPFGFRFNYDDYSCDRGGYIMGRDARFIAGSVTSAADWALLRIEGELTGFGDSGNYYYLGWNAGNLDVFEGYSIHHGSGLPQTFSSFESIGLEYKFGHDASAGSSDFRPCSGAKCSHFGMLINDDMPGGASGAPLFVVGSEQVVGTYTNADNFCHGSASRFSKMYQDGRVEGALTYGDDYFFARGEAANFDDSARPDYNVVPLGEPLPPECVGKGLVTARGDGTRTNPYQLGTLCQLQDVDSQRSAHYRLTTDIDASSSRAWNGGRGFVPIGQNLEFSQVFESDGGGGVLQRSDFRARKLDYAFSGSFDGAGFLINGLVANRQREDFVGLFSITSEAEFKNVQLLNSEINGREGAGSLAGVIFGGTVSNFRLTGSVEGDFYVGGLAGLSEGSIRNGYTTGPVLGVANVGSLVGWSLGGVISNSYATGSVSGNSWAGSLVGDNWGQVVNSYASGEVYVIGIGGVIGTGRWVGGLLGDNRWGFSSGSFQRTLPQLRCPTGPGQNCLGETTYASWSERDWYFGNRNTLPIIRAQLPPPVIEGEAEQTLQVLYGVESVAFTLAATAVDVATLEWQLLPGSGPGVAGSEVNFSDDEGAQARVVYLVSGGIQEKDRFSVQVRGLGGSDVITILIEPYSPPEIIADEGLTIAIHARATTSLPLELRALDRDGSAGELKWLVDKRRLAAGSDVNLLVRNEGDESVATLIFARPQNSMLVGTFTVQVTDGDDLQDSVDIAVGTIPNRPPLLMGENPRFLSIFEGKTSTSLELLANDPDPGETVDLQWSAQPVAGNNLGGSRLNFRSEGDQIDDGETGPRAEVFFSRREGSVVGGEFVVSVTDFLGAVSTVGVIVRHIANTSPVISRVFERVVSDVEELTVYISPQVREVTLRAIAFDEFPETLEWTISGTPASVATARFVSGDEAESSTQVSGVREVRVLFQRNPAAVSSSRFVIAVADGLGKSDRFLVRMVEDASSPRIANEGVITTEEGKTLEVEIPYRSERLMLDLFTSSARAGLVGKLASSSPLGTSVSFSQSFGGGQVRVELQVLQSLDVASFTIRVANGNATGAASEEIIILVSRQKFIRVRLKIQLGGAVR